MAATKLKHYFKEHSTKVVSEAPISEIIGNKDASGRIAKWAIQLSPYVLAYERRDAIKSQALADFLVDWAEVQYKPPKSEVDYWKMHFDGFKLKEGLGAGVVLTSPKGDHLRYCSGDWDAKDANMAAYRFHVQKIAGLFEGCEFHHVPRAENEAADTLSKLALLGKKFLLE
ncbi:uncharacterized protein [Lolium perenne]|uniref:uncharacterized protein n=1 Tax=Lolium perenne TaxID=4522 RepID=UPI003A995AA7